MYSHFIIWSRADKHELGQLFIFYKAFEGVIIGTNYQSNFIALIVKCLFEKPLQLGQTIKYLFLSELVPLWNLFLLIIISVSLLCIYDALFRKNVRVGTNDQISIFVPTRPLLMLTFTDYLINLIIIFLRCFIPKNRWSWDKRSKSIFCLNSSPSDLILLITIFFLFLVDTVFRKTDRVLTNAKIPIYCLNSSLVDHIYFSCSVNFRILI